MAGSRMSYPQRDYGDEQPDTLFNASATEPPKCARGCKKKNVCEWAWQQENGIHFRQPTTCLLRYDQANAQVPY